MRLSLKPYSKNLFPIGGILIRSPEAAYWMREIQQMGFTLETLEIFPIPDTVPNRIWGCLIIPAGHIDKEKTGRHALCQMAGPHLLIPERSVIYPAANDAELATLFLSVRHLFHPDFGLLALRDKLDINTLLSKPIVQNIRVIRPAESVFIPAEILSFQVQAVSPEELMKNLEDNVFPKQETLSDKPLNVFEKAKLAMYRLLFSKEKSKTPGSVPLTVSTRLLSMLENLVSRFSTKENKWISRLQKDFEDLSRRNQETVEKLMSLLKDNPAEALKYAIPLDQMGITRGSNQGRLTWTKRWLDFSLFSAQSPAPGRKNHVDLGAHYATLHQQYTATAQEFVNQKDYQKAAFVYLKLLKNYHLAAQTLEAGHYYQEAAMIYFKHTGDKRKAAECYEKGNMIAESIEIYKELKEFEWVGDLYLRIGKRADADFYYEKVVSGYLNNNQYLKASFIYKDKMNKQSSGQNLLLEGWRRNKDAMNCLNNYLKDIADLNILKQQITAIYENDVNRYNAEAFLKAIQLEFKKKNELAEFIREMAYEVVAAQIPENPSIVTELKGFNEKDPELLKDTLRFHLLLKK